MDKLLTYLKSINLKKVAPYWLLACLLIPVVIFVLPQLRQTSKIKLGAADGLTLTADRQDSLGAFTDTHFTLKSDTDLTNNEIKSNITFFPEIDFDIQSKSPREFSVIPKTTLDNNSIYKIQIKTNQKIFSWAFQTKNDFRVVQTLPRDRATYVPLNSGIEISFSHDNWEDVKDHFSITPKVSGRFERHNRTLTFVPDTLTPSTLYTVTITKGIKLKNTEETLKEDYQFRFETKSEDRDFSQQISFMKHYYEFSTSEKPVFDLYSGSESDTKISVSLYKYPSPNQFQADLQKRLTFPSWASVSLQNHKLATEKLTQVSTFETSLAKQIYQYYFFLPDSLESGQYLVEVSKGSKKIQTLFQVTDVSAYVNKSGNKTLVWVNSVKSGEPLPQARVAYNGREIFTDDNGTAYFDTLASDLEQEKGIVEVKHSQGIIYLPLSSNQYYFDKKYQDESRNRDKYWTYLYLDRPTYLPGDTLKFWGLLRDRDQLSKKQDLTIQVSRSDYNSWSFTPIILYKGQVTTGDIGTFISEVSLKNYSPGWYSLDIMVGGKTVISSGFSVETYTKPAYQISLTDYPKAIIIGSEAKVTGKVSFFEGSPVQDLSLKVLSNQKESFVKTDSQGNFSFTKTPSFEEYSNYSPQYHQYSIMPQNPEEATINSSVSIAVFDSSQVFTYPMTEVRDSIGTVTLDLRKVEVNKYQVGNDFKKLFDPAQNKIIKGVVYDTSWNKREVGTIYDFINKKSVPKYEYDQVKNQIGEVTLTTDQSGKATHTIPVPTGKSYEIQYVATDDQGRNTHQTAYLYGANEQNNTFDYLFLKTDKSGERTSYYTVGEQVNIIATNYKNDFTPGPQDKFLFVLSQRGIRSYHYSKDGKFSFKFPEDFSPNVYVEGVRFNGKTYQSTGELGLMYDTTDKKLSLEINTDKKQYEPGDTAKITVTSKNTGGKPVAAEVNLNLVDEAYYNLYPETLDPLGAIYKTVGSDRIASYLSHQYPLDNAGAEGGGCFLAGTEILMANGKTKEIQKVVIGDIVKTKENQESGVFKNAKVTKIYTHQVSGYLLVNNHLRVTSEHNIFVNGRWMTAGEMKVGDSYLGDDNHYHLLQSIQEITGLYTVYNFEVEKYHTYFADGFYVHNDKGGSVFRDTAFFGTIKTNSFGQGSVEVKLPDNLTSWRISSQAVTNALDAGFETKPLIVKLPFFFIATINDQYLSSDKPTFSVRAFGEALARNDIISLQVDSDSLNLHKTLQGVAFENILVETGPLPLGTHKITFKASSSKGNYKLERSFTVLDSHLSVSKSVYQPLSENTRVTGASNGFTTITFSDQGRGKYFPQLTTISTSYGDRLDQKISRGVAKELIKKYFNDPSDHEDFDPKKYQTLDGGLAIYPYASSDLSLSAFTSALSPDMFDKAALKNYFYKELSQSKDINTAAKALFGISTHNEPVLIQINNLLDDPKVDPESQIYLGLALAQIGDVENATQLYKQILAKHQKFQDNQSFIDVGNSKDEIMLHTALMADLASLVGDQNSHSFLQYLDTNDTKDILLFAEKLYAIKNILSSTPATTATFSYQIGGSKKEKVTLEKGSTKTIWLGSEDLEKITFSDINGSVGVITTYPTPLTDNDKRSSNISISRSYYANGKLTNLLSRGDLVKVSIKYTLPETTQDGCYQITDILPSGLKPVTSPYSLGISSPDVTYPYEINGQKVSFCVYKNSPNTALNYYARVINTGEFKSESVLIQSLISPSIYNFTDSTQITIK